MKKILVTLMVLCCTGVAWAQNDVMTAILQHGDEATAFVGRNALVEAHAAAVDGDQITLSEGSFISTSITKSISIYGAGFEKDETTGTAVTMLTGSFGIGLTDETLSNVRLEGLYINATVNASAGSATPVENMVITKCYVNGDIRFYAPATNVEISKNVIRGSVYGSVTATAFQVLNCWIAGNISSFDASSSVQADHCIICGEYGGAYLYTNCFLTHSWSDRVAEGSVAYNCVYNNYRGFAGNCITENLYAVSGSEMFTDATNADYNSERTFTIAKPEEWIGNDGTEIGINGGKGWSKVPSTPVVKNLKLNVEGKTLKVTYDAEVR